MTDPPEPMGFNDRVGWNLRLYRLRAGLSQADLASALAARGFPFQQPTVLKVERGTRPLRLEEAHAIAEVLGIEPAHLTRYADEVTDAQGAVLEAQHRYAAIKDEMQAHEAKGAALSRELQRAGEVLRAANERLRAATKSPDGDATDVGGASDGQA